MPRYVSLKQMILGDFQDDALNALSLAGKETTTPETKPLASMISQVSGEFLQSRELITKRALGTGTEQLQSDSMSAIKDMIGYISLNKAVNEAVDENIKRGGKDAFDRQYVVRQKDLDVMLDVMRDINQAALLQNDALRKLKRFHKLPPTNPALVEIEKKNRTAVEAGLARAAGLLKGIVTKTEGLTPEVKEKALAAGLAMLAANKGISLAAMEKDAENVLAGGDESASLLAQAMQGIKTLFGERIKTQEELVAAEPPKFVEVKREDWEKQRESKYLLEQLKSDTSLPADVREIMLRALSKEFPQEYKELISAYYASFLKEQKEQKK
jgi:hypothetical protein